MYGFDVEPLPDREVRVERVPDAMAVGYVALDADWSLVHVNAAAERVLRRPRHELVGGVLWDLFPDTVGTVFEERYRCATATGQPVAFEAYYPSP